MYKIIECPNCQGRGFIAHSNDHSIWSESCNRCSTIGVLRVPMTNGDIIRTCTNEQLIELYYNLDKIAVYSGGENNRLLFIDNPGDFLLWLNKEADNIDMNTIFSFIDEEKHDEDYKHLVKGYLVNE